MAAGQNTPNIEHPSLAAALAAFQADLPEVHKGATGQVGQNRNYKYADLADVNRAVLPALGRVGLSFSAKPTLNESGKFVLAYVLRHSSGEEDGGEWPLPEEGTAQQMGSALTYARRYALSAVTGVAPDEDDDGGSAPSYQHRQERPAARQNGQQRHEEPPREPAREQPTEDPAATARGALAAYCKQMGYDLNRVAAKFQGQYGQPLGEATDAARVRAFTKLLDGMPGSELGVVEGATNGAQA